MRTIRTIAEMRAWLGNARAEGRTVGLVPTMGAFHAGHHSLMQAAREEQDSVVVSLFVNPAQFNDTARPRRLPAHRGQRRGRGGRPRRRRPLRPAGRARSTPTASPRRCRSAGLAEVLEGAERGPGHFAGVCTVVNKLLQHRRARTSPTSARRTRSRSRSSSGWCATSTCRCGSRSCRPCASPTGSRCPRATSASPPTTAPAPSASRARCSAAAAAVAAGERDADAIRAAALAELGDVDAEYLAIVDPLTFAPLRTVSGPHAGRDRRAGRARPPDRQHRPRTRPGGDRLSRRQPSKGAENVHAPQGSAAQARDAHQARRDAGAGRADRDDHRLRPPERARGRAGRRRRRPGRRLGGQQRARLLRHGPGHGRGAADAHRAPSAAA